MSGPIAGVFFDFGDTLVVEEPGKHLWEMTLTPIPHALDLLAWLRPRVRVGIVSNTVGSGDADVWQVVERAGMAPYVDALVTSRDFGTAKPDPAIFHEAARRLGVPLGQTCMVGDRLETDIAGARAAGIPGVWLRHPHARAQPPIEAAHVITDLSQLRDWIVAASAPGAR
ncbi:MAG TPA: HAD family hydrolase [Candidatus Limnocylindrales bacterium]|nr:HAD family hydrolase [Candidatus Limnocylindrales bacterium]